MCGEEDHDVISLPIDQMRQAVQLTDEQSAALDDLANALAKAAQGIRAACPTDLASTAPGRLEAMQHRLEAIAAALNSVRPALEKFYGLLNDEGKARFGALADEQRRNSTEQAASASPASSCGATQPGVTEWPAAEIERRLHPSDAQRASLAALQDASNKASDMLKASCQAESALTPPARLATAASRVDTMLQAVKLVRSALDGFYATLSDEQKAQFEAIGRERARQRA
jgi:hypothetical protein